VCGCVSNRFCFAVIWVLRLLSLLPADFVSLSQLCPKNLNPIPAAKKTWALFFFIFRAYVVVAQYLALNKDKPNMTWTMFVGCCLVSFGPPLALFLFFISKNAPLVVLMIGRFAKSSLSFADAFWVVNS
jgi:hypothetical protein